MTSLSMSGTTETFRFCFLRTMYERLYILLTAYLCSKGLPLRSWCRSSPIRLRATGSYREKGKGGIMHYTMRLWRPCDSSDVLSSDSTVQQVCTTDLSS